MGSHRYDENSRYEVSFASGPLAGDGGAVSWYFCLLNVNDPTRGRPVRGGGVDRK